MGKTLQAMTASIEKEIDIARQLHSVLQEEQSHLLASSIDALEVLIAKKADLIAQLSQYSRDRHECMKNEGYETSMAGMDKWLENAAGNANEKNQLKANWNELVSLSQAAKELNRLNGQLISSHMARNQQALAILHGNSQQNTGMYGPDGHPSRVPATPVRSVVTG